MSEVYVFSQVKRLVTPTINTILRYALLEYWAMFLFPLYYIKLGYTHCWVHLGSSLDSVEVQLQFSLDSVLDLFICFVLE